MPYIKLKPHFWLCFFTALIISALIQPCLHAQTLRDEVLERPGDRLDEPLTLEERRERGLEGIPRRIRQRVNLSYGYNTNPQFLATNRQSDQYQHLRYSFNFDKTFLRKNQFSFAWDISQDKYNRLETLTNTLGHAHFSLKHALAKEYIFSMGYDHTFTRFSSSRSSTFNNHKVFAQFEHRITKNFFHQLKYEFGWKFFDESKAIDHDSALDRGTERKDVREAVGYSIGYTLSDRISTRLSLKTFFNNSNAYFQDFHDYHQHEIRPRIAIKVTDDLTMNFNGSVKRKEYSARMNQARSNEQEDHIYQAGTGLNYRLNGKHHFNLDYTYYQNESNDSLSHYTASQIEGGYQFNF